MAERNAIIRGATGFQDDLFTGHHPQATTTTRRKSRPSRWWRGRLASACRWRAPGTAPMTPELRSASSVRGVAEAVHRGRPACARPRDRAPRAGMHGLPIQVIRAGRHAHGAAGGMGHGGKNAARPDAARPRPRRAAARARRGCAPRRARAARLRKSGTWPARLRRSSAAPASWPAACRWCRSADHARARGVPSAPGAAARDARRPRTAGPRSAPPTRATIMPGRGLPYSSPPLSTAA